MLDVGLQPGRAFMRIILVSLVAGLLQANLAFGQGATSAEDIRQGHRLASQLCSMCHLATPDQAALPILHPPGPPFATILKRKDLTAEWLTDFLKVTHRGLDKPKGMPNLDLADYQIKQIVAYLMSRYQQ